MKALIQLPTWTFALRMSFLSLILEIHTKSRVEIRVRRLSYPWVMQTKRACRVVMNLTMWI